ncbi:hypothetical protein [Nitrincola sp.]|uniref:hypothetical protein n=1 Tax=Nitrincola sp. TaxID=1926584 RepID=UPI003A9265DB
METIEELKEGLEKLKNKNAQLLDEKKKVQAERDELKALLDSTEQAKAEALAEVKRITIDQPRAEVIETIAAEGMADMLKRELEHHFEIVRMENGKDVFQKDGEPVQIEGATVEFSEEGINKLYKAGTLKSLGRLIKGRQAAGGGAVGGTKEAFTGQPQNSNPAPRQQFGLK